MRVLLTNDDGIEAAGLQALRSALLEVDGIELAVIAPDGNRSAMARSITTRRPLWVQEVDFDDGTVGYATDGTPVDCVRLANLGLVEGFEAELVVSGINHGSNLGDDITYSGTVAAALEAIVLGLPGDRGLAAVERARARLQGRDRIRLHGGGVVHGPPGRGARAHAVAGGDAAERERAGRAAGGCRGGAARQARVPATSCRSSTRTARNGGCTRSTATRATSATRPGPIWPRWRRARSR